jgi:hypothetical protein
LKLATMGHAWGYGGYSLRHVYIASRVGLTVPEAGFDRRFSSGSSLRSSQLLFPPAHTTV